MAKQRMKMAHKANDVVWVTIKSVGGNYIGPAKVTNVHFEGHYWVRLPILVGERREFFVFETKMHDLINEEALEDYDEEKEEDSGEREEAEEDA